MKRCCFLDRDGVVNVEVNYLHEPEKVQLIPGIVEALRSLHAYGYLAIVVTNQAGVAKGMYDESAIRAVHKRIQELLAVDGEKIDDFFYCPHHPDKTGPCRCRKPGTGMIDAAKEKYNIDIAESFLIGDRLSDLEAGRNAGCKTVYLVRTGYGAELVAQEETGGATVAEDVLDAVSLFFQGKY